MSEALIEYVRKPNKIQKERTTVLYEDRIVGEKGDELALDDVESIQYKKRWDGVHKLVLTGHDSRIVVSSQIWRDKRIRQDHSMTLDFFEQIHQRAPDDCRLIRGSNLQFYAGITIFLLSLAGTAGVGYLILTDQDRPRGLLSVLIFLVIGVLMIGKGRAKASPIRPSRRDMATAATDH